MKRETPYQRALKQQREQVREEMLYHDGQMDQQLSDEEREDHEAGRKVAAQMLTAMARLTEKSPINTGPMATETT